MGTPAKRKPRKALMKLIRRLKNSSRNELGNEKRYNEKLAKRFESVACRTKKSKNEISAKQKITNSFKPAEAITTKSSIWTVKK